MMDNNMRYIAVFCSANDLDEKYTTPAREFARLLAENGYGLVWGGSDTGLMKEIAEEVRAGGGQLIGVSMKVLEHLVREDVDEKIIAKDLGERKSVMLSRCHAIVMLVGGIGTLDEITEMMELKKHRLHDKPIVVLNTEGFYEGMKIQLQRMKDEGFIKLTLDDLLHFAATPDEAIKYINKNLNSMI